MASIENVLQKTTSEMSAPPRGNDRPSVGSDAVRSIVDSLPRGNGGDSRRMLPKECYTSPDFFDFERRAVFVSSWICVGRVEQISAVGDCLSANPAGEPVLIVRRENGEIGAMATVCQHRGQVIPCSGNQRSIRCPLHSWTYGLDGRLKGAPRMDADEVRRLRETVRLPPVRLELWHGFIFVNLDPDASPLGPSLTKVEPFWAGYEAADLAAIPPKLAEQPLPWNWKVHVENFTDAYHPEFVHRGTHDFAPSVMEEGGVVFTEMAPGDNAIVRTVPMIRPDGGMMCDGWGEPAEFPPITTLSAAQRQRLTFVLIPPSMTMVFAPNAIAYTLLQPIGVEATLASSDRVTAGGWLMPRTTMDLPDFAERAARVLEGAAKIWAQDVPENKAMQRGKHSRFAPDGLYGPLETTLIRFNAWLIEAYRKALDKLNDGRG